MHASAVDMVAKWLPGLRRDARYRRSWRFHIGAQKTATTHLQYTLDARADELRAFGVGWLPSEILRTGGYLKLIRKKKGVNGKEILNIFDKIASKAGVDFPTVALSNENIAGPCRDAFCSDLIYRNSIHSMKNLRTLSRQHDLSIFISIRSFDKFLPAAYAQALKHKSLETNFEPIRQRSILNPPTWTEYVMRIKRALPWANLTVWRYEDYAAHQNEIMTAFTGVELPVRPPLPIPSRTKTMSARAVAEIERLNLPNDELYEGKVRDIVAAFGDGEKFNPFTADEGKLLADAYKADLKRLEVVLPGTLLKF